MSQPKKPAPPTTLRPQAPRIRKSPNWISSVIPIALAALLLADFKGWLSPVQDRLDSADFTYSFGRYEISPYNILQWAVVIIVALWLASIVSKLLGRQIGRMKAVHPATKSLLQKSLSVFLHICGGLLALHILGADIAGFTLIGAIMAIGFGFGLRNTASNLINGLVLMLERSVRIGDRIGMEDGTTGIVRRANLRHILIETTSREIMIPNDRFAAEKITNWTLHPARARQLAEIPVWVSARSDIELARNILLEIAASHPSLIREAEPQCLVKRFGPSSIELSLLVSMPEASPVSQAALSDLNLEIWTRLRAAGIETGSGPQ